MRSEESSEEENLVILEAEASTEPSLKAASTIAHNAATVPLKDEDIITLNIGGHTFTTTRQTLTVSKQKKTPRELAWFASFLDEHSPRSDGSYFIDRDGQFFSPVLTWLRTGVLSFPPSLMTVHDVKREAAFYGIGSLVSHIDRYKLNGVGWDSPGNDMTKRDIATQLNTRTSNDEPLLFHALTTILTIAGLTLKGLDLKRTRLQNVEFHKCDLDGSSFSGSTLVDVTFHGSNLQTVDFVLAKFKSAGADGVITNPFSGRTNLDGAKFSANANILTAMHEYFGRWGYSKGESGSGTVVLHKSRR